MLALAVLLAIPVGMWLGQSLLLRRAGLPLRWRLGARALPERLKRLNRALTYVLLVAAVLIYPVLRDSSPLRYYAAYFPAGPRPLELLHGLVASVLYIALLFLAWTLTDNVRFEIRHSAPRLIRRLAGVPFMALLIALVEELLFRAVLLSDLLETLPTPVAISVGVVAFAGAHYVRSVKRYWTFPGHLALGTLLCLAFVWTRGLWLPIGLHAGGILMLMGTRPLIRYVGPAWLVGASIFPYAGVVGLAGLAAITLNMWLSYGN